MLGKLRYRSSYSQNVLAHSVEVAHLTGLLAGEMGLDISKAKRVGLLHDIGKVGVPDSVLLKEGPLTDAEFEVMQRHTEIGFAMLNSSDNPVLAQAAIIARHHHEHWEGSGYCTGLSGADIPMVARIVSLADVYDALRSSRRYKPPYGHLDAVEIITRGDMRTSPEMFDPMLLGLFADHHGRFESIYNSMPDQLV